MFSQGLFSCFSLVLSFPCSWFSEQLHRFLTSSESSFKFFTSLKGNLALVSLFLWNNTLQIILILCQIQIQHLFQLLFSMIYDFFLKAPQYLFLIVYFILSIAIFGWSFSRDVPWYVEIFFQNPLYFFIELPLFFSGCFIFLLIILHFFNLFFSFNLKNFDVLSASHPSVLLFFHIFPILPQKMNFDLRTSCCYVLVNHLIFILFQSVSFFLQFTLIIIFNISTFY